MLNEIFRGLNRLRRPWGSFQVEISTYSSMESQVHPRMAFPELWIYQKMSMQVFKNLAAHFAQAKWVSFGGWGDPLENADFLSMLSLAQQAQCLTALTTNGINLTEEVCLGLVRHGLDLLVISLEMDSQRIIESLRKDESPGQVLNHVEALIRLKKRLRRNKPRIKLSLPMTRMNMSEIPDVVVLAARLGVEEITFTNLDYLPEERWNILRAFHHESATPAFQKTVEEMGRLGKDKGVGVRVYPLKAEEVAVCGPNPIRNIFISSDGLVAPCSYLKIPKKGDIPRIFLNKAVRVPQISFGNTGQESLPQIWSKEPYQKFRKIFEDRKRAAEVFAPLPPLSEVCQTCYKAYGL